jgi:hypothetical protein
MVVGSFKKIFDSQRIEFIPQVQSVVDPGVTGSKHMGDPPLRLDRYPTLVVAEEAGHSVASVVTATNPLPTQIQPSPVEMEHVSTVPVVTATNRPTEHENLLSFYILLNPRLRTLSKILLRDAMKVFNDIAYNRFAMSFYHSVES